MNLGQIGSTGASRGSLKSYAAGFLLALALTLVAFGLALAGGSLPRWVVLSGIFAAALVQILVHLHYFLHLDTSSAARWNVVALVCAVWIILLFAAGTIWIMTNLNSRMM